MRKCAKGLEKELETIVANTPKEEEIDKNDIQVFMEELKKISAENETKSIEISKKQANLQVKQRQIDQEAERLRDMEDQENDLNKGAKELLDVLKTKQIDKEEKKKRK